MSDEVTHICRAQDVGAFDEGSGVRCQAWTRLGQGRHESVQLLFVDQGRLGVLVRVLGDRFFLIDEPREPH